MNVVYLSIVITVHTNIFIGIYFYKTIYYFYYSYYLHLEHPVRACVHRYILFDYIEICNKTIPFPITVFPRFPDYFTLTLCNIVAFDLLNNFYLKLLV